MMHVPICPVCGENEVGSLPGGTEYYCSTTCNRIACEEASAMVEEFREEYYEDEADYYASWRDADAHAQYDDDPSPYAGTYSEE